jgi:Ras-related protein Rab-1A
MADFDKLFKFLIIGNSGVGKSALLTRYIDEQFSDNFFSTIGVDFKKQKIELEGKTYML